MKKPMAAAAALLTILTLPLALDAGPLPRPQLSFEKNLGQTHEAVDFIARGRRYAATLHAGSYSMALRTGGADKLPRWTLSALERFAKPSATPWVISMYLVAANAEAAPEGLEPLAARSHYLRGNDPSKWQTDVPHFGRVRYKNVYPGIDIEYYGDSGAMEFDFLVRPGADPGLIRMEFEGAVSAEIDDEGDLVLRRGEQELRHRKPLVYQTVLGQPTEIEGRYNLEEDGAVTFRLSDYDAGLAVVIDPLIVGQTFGGGGWQQTFGGSGNDEFNAVAIGPDGAIHVAGTTESTDIPAQGGWNGESQGGPSDAYVATLGPDGGLINATFLGGSGQDIADDIVVDPNGVIYVVGTTNSPNFPVTDGAFQPMFGGGPGDAFVTMFSPDGSDLIGSTFLGGPGLELGTGIALDNQGHGFFVTGATFEDGFPVTPGAFQTDFMGEADGFVSKIDGLAGKLVASTLYGGAGLDIPIDIVVGDDGNPYITGETDSPDVPLTDSAFQPQPGGGIDVFGAEFSGDLDDLDFGTYLGGPGDDRPGGVDLDPFGGVWIGGSTDGGLPTTPNAPNPDFLGGPTDGFLVRIPRASDAAGPPPGGLGLLNGAPFATYTGDANRNAVLDVEFVNDLGRMFLVTSRSNFSEDPSPVAGCGDEPRVGVTGSMNVFDPTTGMFINVPMGPPDGNCLPDGDILDLEVDPFFDPGNVFGSGFEFTENGSDGTVIEIDTDSVFESAAGADLELEKRLISPGEKSAPGGLRGFAIDVRSKGPASAVNVRVTDGIPPGYTVTKIDSLGGRCTQADGEVRCELGTMAPKTAKTILIVGRAPGDSGDYVNTALATADNLNGPTRIASADLKVRPSVPLDITITVVSSSSSNFEYLIEVQNLSGNRDATNVKLENVLPPEISGVQFETSKGVCRIDTPSSPAGGASMLNCTLDVLPAGEKWEIRVSGTPTELRAEIRSTATVDSDAVSLDFGIFTVNKLEGGVAADVSLQLWLAGSDQTPGSCRELEAAVLNRGLDDAEGVRVEIDQISAAELKTVDGRCAASGSKLTCDIGGIAASQSERLSFVVCAAGEPLTARFSGQATATTPDPDPTNNYDSTAGTLDPNTPGVRVAPGGIIGSSGFRRPLSLSFGSDPSLFGENLADGIIVADTVPLPVELGGVSVELNGILAPLIFVSPNQINFQSPWELMTDTRATVVVRNNGEKSLPAKGFIVPFNPGIFTTTQTGSGQAAVLIANTAILAAPEGSIPGAATRPVKVGGFISIFATGLGAVDNRPETGAATSTTTLARTKTNPVVTIGGVEAGLAFSGLAPGFVGLYQVNAEVATGTPVGDAVELVLSSGLVPSNTVTIAVAP